MIRLLEATIRPLRTHFLVLTERIRHRVAYNPFGDAITQDPYPTYAALRARSPVHRSLLTHAWVLTRYADVDAVLRDHRRFSNDPRRREAAHRGIGALPAGPDDYSRLLLDPPEHTRLRRLVNEAFTPRAVEALEPRIRTITAELLERVATPASFDLVRDVAQPLPLRVITWMLGVPPESFRRFEVWSKQRARLLELTVTARERANARAAGRAMDEIFAPIMEARRAEPQDDIISVLARGNEHGERMTPEEALDMLRVLLVAGNETTANLIGNGMLALLKHPAQLERLREEPGEIDAAVEEMLRFDSPVQCDFRVAVEHCEIGEVPIRPGDSLILLIGAANRDPEVFERADEFDIGRRGTRHLAFGQGIHHCIGAQSARLQARIAIGMLLERFTSMRTLGGAPRFRSNSVMRGLESLHVSATIGPAEPPAPQTQVRLKSEIRTGGRGEGRCCMIQLRRERGRFSNFSFRTPQRRISAYPARPSG